MPLGLDAVETVLRDGTPVLARPIRPDDKQLLRDGFERLSEESRYRRFMAPVNELGDEQLRYLTEVDGVDHVAWVAVRSDRPDEGVGVARFVRVQGEPEVAEAAVTVVDEYQGRGVGTLLLGLLAAAARSAGIRAFRAYVLEQNAPMRELLEELGGHAEHDSPGLLRLDIPISVETLPDSPAGRILRAVAARLVAPIPRRLVL
jgi:GNAT superfamily N-acetyltransferase